MTPNPFKLPKKENSVRTKLFAIACAATLAAFAASACPMNEKDPGLHHARESPPAPVLMTQSGDAGVHVHSQTTDASNDAQGRANAVAGDLMISAGWARAMLPGQPTGGAYLTITNKGTDADRLLGATSPAAGKVQIHSMEMTGDVMVMRPVEGGIEIPAGATVEFKPGGMHIMFIAVSQPFRVGGTIPLTLEFAKAGKVQVMLPVAAAQGGDH